MAEGTSNREAARLTGVAETTVRRWKAEAEGRGTEEELEVAELLLEKSKSLLTGIEGVPGSKAQQEVATAVDKLLGKYLTMTGRVTEQHVTIESSGKSESLDQLIAQLLKPSEQPVAAESEKV